MIKYIIKITKLSTVIVILVLIGEPKIGCF